MACPCVEDTDCIHLEVLGDSLSASPIIRPAAPGYVGTIDCHADGFSSGLKGGPGLSAVDDGDGYATLNLDQIAAWYHTAASGSATAIAGGTLPSGIIGPTVSLTAANPLLDRAAQYVTIFHANGELLGMGQDAVWRVWSEYNINGGAFTQTSGHEYDTRHPFNGGVLQELLGHGSMIQFDAGVLAAGASVTHTVRKWLLVLANPNLGNVVDSGIMEITTLVIVT